MTRQANAFGVKRGIAMTTSYECFSCQRVFFDASEKKCPSCGKTNGQLLSEGQLEAGIKGGAIFEIDLKTGKRTKKRK